MTHTKTLKCPFDWRHYHGTVSRFCVQTQELYRFVTPNQRELDHQDGRYLWDLNHPQGYGNRMGRYRTRVEMDFIQRHLPPSPLRILDVGGGSGRISAPLQALGHDLTVLDRNPRALELARRNGLNRIVTGDLLNFDDTGFQAAICMEVLEYFPDCSPVLAKCASFLQPGGTFIFCIINAQSWRFKLQQLSKNHSGATGFTRAEIQSLLARNGFRIIGQRGFQWSLARTGSNSPLISLFQCVEHSLALGQWLNQSPWLLYACRKN